MRAVNFLIAESLKRDHEFMLPQEQTGIVAAIESDGLSMEAQMRSATTTQPSVASR
jgi:hypothetical protein